MWNSSKNETKKSLVIYLGHIFALIYCSFVSDFVVLSLDFRCFCLPV